MKKLSYFLLIIEILTLSSCMNNSFEELLFRNKEDPFFDVPVVDFLTLENTVYINWKEDDACDSFFLMRSRDKLNPDFSCIYSGREISFTDRDLDTEGRYLYRLDKKRGDKIFIGNTYSYAYASGTRKDSSESNDTEIKATHLVYDLECNLPCIQYEYGSYLYKDCDWFYVEVPPMRTVEIIIKQLDHLSNTMDNAPTKLKYLVPGNSEQTILQNSGIPLSNTSYEQKKIYFRIAADTTGLLTASGSACVINYQISLNKIYK